MRPGDTCLCAGEGDEVFKAEQFDGDRVLLSNSNDVIHGWESLSKLEWVTNYTLILRREGRWFKLAFRLAVKNYSCLMCSFSLATHGVVDAAFGVGPPALCADCVKQEEDQEWKPVDPERWYDKDTFEVIKALGDLWLVPRVP